MNCYYKFHAIPDCCKFTRGSHSCYITYKKAFPPSITASWKHPLNYRQVIPTAQSLGTQKHVTLQFLPLSEALGGQLNRSSLLLWALSRFCKFSLCMFPKSPSLTPQKKTHLCVRSCSFHPQCLAHCGYKKNPQNFDYKNHENWNTNPFNTSHGKTIKASKSLIKNHSTNNAKRLLPKV